MEKNDQHREIVACLAQDNDIEDAIEHKVIEQFGEHDTNTMSEGNDIEVDKGQVKIVVCGIRRAVEARRRKQAPEQEQGKKVVDPSRMGRHHAEVV